MREVGPEVMQETQVEIDYAGPSWLCQRNFSHPKGKGEPQVLNREMT